MKYLIALAVLITVGSASAIAAPTKSMPISSNDGIAIPGSTQEWQADFSRMIDALSKPGSKIQETSIFISGNPTTYDPGAFLLNVWGSTQAPNTFDLLSPKVQASRAAFNAGAHRAHYQMTDLAGWENLFLQFDDTNSVVIGIKIYKSLPDGTIYDTPLALGAI
jgi:hypothetical protein